MKVEIINFEDCHKKIFKAIFLKIGPPNLLNRKRDKFLEHTHGGTLGITHVFEDLKYFIFEVLFIYVLLLSC